MLHCVQVLVLKRSYSAISRARSRSLCTCCLVGKKRSCIQPSCSIPSSSPLYLCLPHIHPDKSCTRQEETADSLHQESVMSGCKISLGRAQMQGEGKDAPMQLRSACQYDLVRSGPDLSATNIDTRNIFQSALQLPRVIAATVFTVEVPIA